MHWKKIILLFLSALFGAKELVSQELSYSRYDIKEGLAGSTVYCMTQDADGFLWFGTETGLSRFDGSKFLNFTTADGLPDNEIITLHGDKTGRVWIAPFRPALCYFYKGKLHNQENDFLLKQIKLEGFITTIAEDKEGNLLLVEQRNAYLVRRNGTLYRFALNQGYINNRFVKAGRGPGDGFWLQRNDTLFSLKDSIVTFYRKLDSGSIHFSTVDYRENLLAWRRVTERTAVTTYSKFFFESVKSNFHFSTNYDFTHVKLKILNDSVVVHGTRKGAFLYNLNQNAAVTHYLQNYQINDVSEDIEGNLWFCSNGGGIFRLNSEHIRNFALNNGKEETLSVTAIGGKRDLVLLGTDMGRIFEIKFRQTGLELEEKIYAYPIAVPITGFAILANRDIVLGSSEIILHYSKDFKRKGFVTAASLKKLHYEETNGLYAATHMMVVRIDPASFKVVDTLWRQRATNVFVFGKDIYVGALDGLYRIGPDKIATNLGSKILLLKNRVTAIFADKDSGLWMATFGNGILRLKNDRVTHHLTVANGLTSNICKTLFLIDNTLWVGTDKGLNKINISDPSLPITTYSSTDGIASDNINTIYVSDTLVFVGTQAGLTYFREDLVAQNSKCLLRLTGIKVNDEIFSYDSSGFALAHEDNNIRFDFVGISYRSVGDIQYRFRLLGLDSAWRTTRETFLSYPTLPSGEYELQLQAINKFGVRSELKKIRFTIEKLIWEKTWFRILAGAVFLTLISLLLWLLTQRVRKREEEKTRINARIAELEQLALRAQMNPHFIFNSLNSIQQYVMDKDVSGANKFISGFSRLIRQTLDFSSKPLVHLQDEVGYLQTYLELEKNRLEEKFNYEVEVSEELRHEDYYIPPMVLQPFLENSLRHGIRYRKDNEGRVIIRVYKGDREIVCVIEDNGVGREQAARNKRTNPIEYQSKGMTLTAKRIDLINKDRQEKIKVEIEDLFHADGSAAGTRVTVSFPEEMA